MCQLVFVQAKELHCCYALGCLELVSETQGLAPEMTVHLMTQAFAIAEFTKFTGIICAKVRLFSAISLSTVFIVFNCTSSSAIAERPHCRVG